MDSIPVGLLDNIGVVGIAVLVIFAYTRGWVVTPRELRQVERDRDDWHKASDTKDAQIAEKDKQLAYLEQVGRTVEQFTRGLQQEIDR